MSESLSTIVKDRKPSMINENNVPSDLDGLESQINTLMKNVRQNIWLLGQRLAYIKENNIIDKEYTDFKDYCNKKLKISFQTAYNAIRIFKTFEIFVTSRIDTSVLHEIAKIKDGEKRNDLLKVAEDEQMSVREMRKIVRKEVESERECTPSKAKKLVCDKPTIQIKSEKIIITFPQSIEFSKAMGEELQNFLMNIPEVSKVFSN